MYVPLEIRRSSDYGEDWIQIIFDRIIQDPGEWLLKIQGTVADLAGNPSSAGAITLR